MTAVSARFYVVETRGYGTSPRMYASSRPASSFAVLDRAFCHCEVYTDYVEERAKGYSTEARRRQAEEKAEALNARHEQHMREVAA